MHASNESNDQNLIMLVRQNPNPQSTEAAPGQPQEIGSTHASDESNDQNHIMTVDQNPNPQIAEPAPDQSPERRRERSLPSDVRNALLTVAVLLAGATYQAAFNPPGGLWQEDGQISMRRTGRVTSFTTEIEQVAGVSILGTKHKELFFIFIFGNTIGFLFSMVTIEYLTGGFTGKLELTLAIAAISSSYGLSVCIISPSEYRLVTAYIVLAAFAIALIVRIGREICDRQIGVSLAIAAISSSKGLSVSPLNTDL